MNVEAWFSRLTRCRWNVQSMLLWEALSTPQPRSNSSGAQSDQAGTVRHCVRRLPFDKRCSCLTKSGTRCRGRIHRDGEYCVFHDPVVAAKRKEGRSNVNKRRRRLSHIPDGYLRRLTSTAAVGNAMDRLYREVRLGVVTPEMGRVLFGILTRLLDADLVRSGPHPERTKAAKIRPNLSKLLTRSEKKAWMLAVDNAPEVRKNDRASRRAAG